MQAQRPNWRKYLRLAFENLLFCISRLLIERSVVTLIAKLAFTVAVAAAVHFGFSRVKRRRYVIYTGHGANRLQNLTLAGSRRTIEQYVQRTAIVVVRRIERSRVAKDKRAYLERNQPDVRICNCNLQSNGLKLAMTQKSSNRASPYSAKTSSRSNRSRLRALQKWTRHPPKNQVSALATRACAAGRSTTPCAATLANCR